MEVICVKKIDPSPGRMGKSMISGGSRIPAPDKEYDDREIELDRTGANHRRRFVGGAIVDYNQFMNR